MKERYFFEVGSGYEYCEDLTYWKDKSIDECRDITLEGAKMSRGDGFYFCTFFGEAGESGEYCGRVCDVYKPRNGKNGRCRYSGNCYEPNGKFYKVIGNKVVEAEK